MKKNLFLIFLFSIFFASCSNMSLDKKEKFTVKFSWNNHISDVYLNKKYIKNGREYEIEGRSYKISWKYKEINTVNYETNPSTYFWVYENININSHSNFNIISNKIEKKY